MSTNVTSSIASNQLELDEKYRTPLHYAAEKGDAEECRRILEEGGPRREETPGTASTTPATTSSTAASGIAIDAADDCGMTALHLAAKYNHPSVMDVLLAGDRRGLVDTPCTRQPYLGHTPLHFGAQVAGGNMVSMLLRLGADPNALARDMDTPLHVAARFGDDAVVEELVRGGGKVDAQNDKGLTPLMVAAGLGRRWLVAALLEADASVDLVDASGNTALHHALQCPLQTLFGGNYPVDNDHYTVGYILIRAGSNIEALNDQQNPPIDFCSSAVKTILSMAPDLPFDNFEQVLNASPSQLESRGVSRKDTDRILEALRKYHAELKEMEDDQKNSGGCPVLNARKKKKQQQQNNSTNGTSGECPIPFHRQLAVVTQHPYLSLLAVGVLSAVAAASAGWLRRASS
eukprot:gb/GECH01000033.1/.p1 GENE.gb/GECH01000033.1/~~gb/GECH01000033.1/.p1  ORF type:complete len:404 (+),score=102.01 gb/GECH01000033.1/:1-1212(+)